MRISLEQIHAKMKYREERGGRAILWSINTDMRDLVQLIKCDFGANDDQAKKLALRIVKEALVV